MLGIGCIMDSTGAGALNTRRGTNLSKWPWGEHLTFGIGLPGEWGNTEYCRQLRSKMHPA